jgi:hypothetical protein
MIVGAASVLMATTKVLVEGFAHRWPTKHRRKVDGRGLGFGEITIEL